MHIVIGLLIAFLCVVFYAWRYGETRACRWRADRARDSDGQHFYRCAQCGAESLSPKDRPPDKCLSQIK